MNDFQGAEAFQAFVLKNRPYWVRLSRSILGRRDEAEDVVQETLARLWERRNRLEVENAGAYAARAVWLNSLKRKARKRDHLPLEAAEDLGAPEAEFFRPPVSTETLQRSLERLPEAQRTVLLMKYSLGLSFKEIGETLKISMNTAGSRCRYALEILRKALGAHRQPPEPLRGRARKGGSR
jgi:RNA polymerase sigma-70 factor, ECF subfamily